MVLYILIFFVDNRREEKNSEKNDSEHYPNSNNSA
jgi:hypothetical protein